MPKMRPPSGMKRGRWPPRRYFSTSRQECNGSVDSYDQSKSDGRYVPENKSPVTPTTNNHQSYEYHADYPNSNYPTPIGAFTNNMYSSQNFTTTSQVLQAGVDPSCGYPQALIANSSHYPVGTEDTLHSKSAFIHFFKVMTSFMAHAKHNDNDQQLLRAALKDFVGENENNSQVISSLIKRIELLEERSDLKKLHDRLDALEKKVSENSNFYEKLNRLESHLNLVEPVENVTDSCTIQPSIDTHQRITLDLESRLAQLEDRQQRETQLFARLESLISEKSVKEKPSEPKPMELNVEDESPNLGSMELNEEERPQSATENEQNKDAVEETLLEVKKEQDDSSDDEDGPMQFVLNTDGWAIVHIDGVGNCGNSTVTPGVRVWFGNEHAMNISRPIETSSTGNKTAILVAAYLALHASIEAGLKKVEIYTSSEYLMRCWNRFEEWHKRNWCSKSGERLKHADDFQKLYSACQNVQVEFKKVTEENKARTLSLKNLFIKKEACEN